MTQTATATEAHKLHPSVVREYDIRGIVPDTLNEADLFAIGQAYAGLHYARKNAAPAIAVARDGRLSSPSLAKALIDGLVSAGANVTDFGTGPTPMLYFAAATNHMDAGLMLTGSHNPPTHNGVKMVSGGKPFYGEDIRALADSIGSWPQRQGSVKQADIRDAYTARLLEEQSPAARPLSIAWDGGNGATGEIIDRLSINMPDHEHACLYTEIDGRFPNHHPDPSVEKNLEDLAAVVQAEGCDIGLAFDGDGDRLGVVDELGRAVSSDRLLMLFCRDVLSTTPGATLIADVKTSQTVFNDIQAQGGTPLMWKTGHSHIKMKMRETGAVFGGEASGHLFFADRYYGFDDGLYAAMRIIRYLASQDQPLSTLVDALPGWHSTPELRIDCDEERKFVVIDEIRERLDAAGQDYLAIDGVRVMQPEGWWLIRASNTQAAIIARAEAQSEEDLAVLTDMLEKQLNASDVTLPH
jgi:phosphomannomutase